LNFRLALFWFLGQCLEGASHTLQQLQWLMSRDVGRSPYPLAYLLNQVCALQEHTQKGLLSVASSPLLDQCVETLNLLVDSAHRKLTEAGDAQRTVDIHQDRFRFVPAWAKSNGRGKWLMWDGTRYTSTGAAGALEAAVCDTNKALYNASAALLHELERTLDEEQVKLLRKSPSERNAAPEFAHVCSLWDRTQAALSWAKAGESAARIKNAARLTEAHSLLHVQPNDLDTDGYLFNCINGVIDLRTGALLPHSSERLITLRGEIPYEPLTACPRWLRFLGETLIDPAVIEFYQRFVGYCMVGDVVDHVMLLDIGDGSNGKGVAHRLLHKVFGDYALTIDPEILLVKKGEPHPTGIAQMHGKRWVHATEPQKGRHLDEALVKRLTGGDTLSGRRMNEDFWTFTPSHTLSLEANDLPPVSGQDNGIWRRIVQLQWRVAFITGEESTEEMERKTRTAVKVLKMIPGMEKTLHSELPGILAWCVRGCMMWQKFGLAAPAAVKVATDAYRADQNTLGDFLLECTARDENAFVTKSELHTLYTQWCESVGEKGVMNNAQLSSAMVREGFDKQGKDPSGKTRAWRGIRLTKQQDLINRKVLVDVPAPSPVSLVRK